MSSRLCCVTDCTTRRGGVTLFTFPNPNDDSIRFQEWVKIIGTVGDFDNEFIFRNRRVCQKHFETKFQYTDTRKLTKTAVPTLHLTGVLQETLVLFMCVKIAHSGISANEIVDSCAKEAVETENQDHQNTCQVSSESEMSQRILRSTKSPRVKPAVLSDDDESQVDDDGDEDYTVDDDEKMSSRVMTPVFELVLDDHDFDSPSASTPNRSFQSQKSQDRRETQFHYPGPITSELTKTAIPILHLSEKQFHQSTCLVSSESEMSQQVLRSTKSPCVEPEVLSEDVESEVDDDGDDLRSTNSPRAIPEFISDDDESQIDDDGDEDYTVDDDENMSSREMSPVFEMVLDDHDSPSASKLKRSVQSQKTQDSKDSQESINLKLCRACLAPRAPHPLPAHAPLLPTPPPAPAPRPAALCAACVREMARADRFVARARRAEEVMRRAAEVGMLTMETLKHIDREKYQLTHTSTFSVKHIQSDFYNYKFVFDDNETALPENVTNITDDVSEGNASLRQYLDSVVFVDPFQTVNLRAVNDAACNFSDCNTVQPKMAALKECLSLKTTTRKEKPAKPKRVRKRPPRVPKPKKIKPQKVDTVYKQKVAELKNVMDEYFEVTVFNTIEDKIAELQRRKNKVSYMKAPFKCEMCYLGYLDNVTYDAHMHKHTEQCGAFMCPVCQYRCHTKVRVRQHMFRHSRKYSCKMCCYETHDRSRAKLHMRFHEGQTYKCKHCERVFNHLVNLHSHIRTKHPSDNVCPLCGYSFIGERGLATHRTLTHGHDRRPIPEDGPSCEECGVKFATDAALQIHLNVSSRHGKTGENFKKRNYYQLHRSLRSEWPAKERARKTIVRRNGVRVEKREIRLTKFDEPVPCEKCGALIASPSEYHHHFKREHPNEKRTWYPATTHPHLCEMCGKMLRTNALKDHMEEHVEGVTFKCSTCGKRFARKFNMKLHSRIHLGERYPCAICGKLFNHMGNRDRHVRNVHTESKDFKCEFCGKCFKHDGARKLHTNHVHLKKPYPKRNRQRETHTKVQAATQPKDAAGQPSTELQSFLTMCRCEGEHTHQCNIENSYRGSDLS